MECFEYSKFKKKNNNFCIFLIYLFPFLILNSADLPQVASENKFHVAGGVWQLFVSGKILLSIFVIENMIVLFTCWDCGFR